MLIAFATSAGSFTGRACAAMESPAIAIGSDVSRLSSTRSGRPEQDSVLFGSAGHTEVEGQAVIHVANGGCLGPAARAVRRHRHDPMLVTKLEDLLVQRFI